jgi:hypothetical protein
MKPTKVTPLQNNRNHNNVCRWHRKRPQPWTWAQKHERRLEKGWNWQADLMPSGEHTKRHVYAVRAVCSVQMESVRVRWQASTRVDDC